MSVQQPLPDDFSYAVADGVPAIWKGPPGQRREAAIAIWLPPFTETKEWAIPALRQFASAGFIAISIDPWQHGERGVETADELTARVFKPGSFRRSMWPIIGQTTLDAVRVLDWATQRLTDQSTVVAGGLSMGGDVAVALAGIDQRIRRVAAIVATPDWTRPGMRHFHAPFDVVEQGDADRYANWFFSELNPLSHLERYRRECAILFECAEVDNHVPPDGALRFRDSLRKVDPDGPLEVRVNLHDGLEHSDGGTLTLFQNCFDWLTR